jgi:hypothetical protein
MDEEARKAREFTALELIASELEQLRMLKEYELGVRVENDEGNLYVRSVEKR